MRQLHRGSSILIDWASSLTAQSVRLNEATSQNLIIIIPRVCDLSPKCGRKQKKSTHTTANTRRCLLGYASIHLSLGRRPRTHFATKRLLRDTRLYVCHLLLSFDSYGGKKQLIANSKCGHRAILCIRSAGKKYQNHFPSIMRKRVRRQNKKKTYHIKAIIRANRISMRH